MKTVLLLISFIVSGMSFAKTLLYLGPLKGDNQLDQTLKRSINKSILEYLLARSEFQLVLNSLSIPGVTQKNALAINGHLTKVNQKFTLSFDLLDLRNKILVNRVSLSNIRDEDLIRMTKAGLESLFVPLKKKKEREEASPPQSNASMEEELPEVISNVDEEKVIDFKERIASLQAEADSSIKERQLEKDQNESNKKVSPLSRISSTPSERIQLETEVLEPPRTKKSQVFDYFVVPSFERRYLTSDALVKTSSQVNLMHLDAGAEVWSFFNKKIILEANYDLSIPLETTVRDEKIKTPRLNSLGFRSRYRLTSERSILFGVQKEDYLFFNLIDQGQGITAGTVDSVFLTARFDFILPLNQKNPLFSVEYRHLLSAALEWPGNRNDIKRVEGSLLRVSAIIPKAIYSFDGLVSLSRGDLNLAGTRNMKIQDFRMLMGLHFKI